MAINRSRTDKNQTEVVAQLRKQRMSVQILAGLRQGVPDLLIGFAGVNFLIELKSTAHLWLTPDEEKWHANWEGAVDISNSYVTIIDRLIDQVRNVRDNGDKIIEMLERMRDA